MKHILLKTILLLLLSILSSSIVLSCADSTPEIARVYYTVIYDFIDATLPPQVRLSVFIEPLSDKRRVKEISLYHKDSDYTWDIDNPLLVKDGDTTYFGHHDIVFPPGTELREGRYEVRFYDLAMRNTTSYFTLEKLPSLKEAKTGSLTAAGFLNKQFASECSVEQITIYDVLSNVLYTGRRTIEIDSNENIIKMYPAAYSYRLFYRNQDNSTIVLLPEVQLIDQQNTGIDEGDHE